MIETSVFSYWNKEGFKNTSGFNSFKDYLYSQTLAISQAKKFFSKVKFITNDFGVEQIKKIRLDSLINEVDTSFNQFDKTLSRHFWGYTKSFAYTRQQEPFIHIDNDFYFFNVEESLKNCTFGFQSPETFDKDKYSYYYELLRIHENAPFPIEGLLGSKLDHGVNCGIVACNQDTHDILYQAYELATYYITKNIEHLMSFNPEYRIHLNLFSEQFILSHLLDKYGVEPYMLFDGLDFKQANKPEKAFCHLWGTTKRDEDNMAKIRKRVINEQPEIAEKIERYYK